VNWDGFGWGSGDGGSRRRATREDLLNELGSIMEMSWMDLVGNVEDEKFRVGDEKVEI